MMAEAEWLWLGAPLLLLVGVALAVHRWRRPPAVRCSDGVPLPSPPELGWWMGHAPGASMSDAVARWFDECGDATLVQLRLGPVRAVVTRDARTAKALWASRPSGLRRLPTYCSAVFDLVGDGPSNTNDEKWAKYRPPVAQAFTRSAVSRRADVVRRHIDAQLDSWLAEAPLECGDVRPLLSRVTLHIMIEMVLGLDMFDPEYRALWAGIEGDMDDFFRTLGWRVRSPVPWWRWWSTAATRREAAVVQRLFQRVVRRVKEARTIGCDAESVKDTYMALMLQDDEFTDKEISNQLLAILTSGNETSYISMCWLCLELGRDAALQDELRAAVAASDDPANEPLVQAVVNEVMRVHPPVPFNSGALPCDATVEADGRRVVLPKGLLVGGAILQMSAAIMPQGRKFDARSWLALTPEESLAARANIMTFGHGFRRCPGEPLVNVELPHIVVGLVKRFRLSTPLLTDDQVPTICSLIERPNVPVTIRFERV